MSTWEGNALKTASKKIPTRATDEDVAQAVELVERYGLSLREVAKKFDVTYNAVWNWVQGRHRGATRGQ